jgi:hypothetical protein
VGFSPLTPGRGRRNEGDEVLLSVDPTIVRVVIAAALAKRHGWTAGKKLSVQLGDGHDTGYMWLGGADAPDAGWTLASAGGGRDDLRLRLRRWDELPSRFPARGVAVTEMVGREGVWLWMPWVPPRNTTCAMSIPTTSTFTIDEGEELRAAGGDVEYRQAKRALRNAGHEVRPYEEGGTDSSVDGVRQTREQIVVWASALLNVTGQTS